MDREERLYRTALGCYLAAIALLQEYPLEADAEVSRTYKSVLRQIQTDVSDSREPEVLERSREALSGTVRQSPPVRWTICGP
jgi:hypothetical protein